MGEIYIVRHGQASYGAEDYDRLSDLGHQQSDWLGQHFLHAATPFDRVVCGSLRRHRETFVCLNKSLNIKEVSEDPRLNEMPYFQLEKSYLEQTCGEMPQTQDEMKAHFARVVSAWERGEIAESPESYEEFSTRVLAALFEHARKGGRVLFVCSGGCVGFVMRHVLALGVMPTVNVILATQNSSYSRFFYHDGALRLMQYNAIPHLETPERRLSQTYL